MSPRSPAQVLRRDDFANPYAEQAGERVIDERGDQDAEDDRDRLAKARREHQREELGLVADLADGDHEQRNEKSFHEAEREGGGAAVRRTAQGSCGCGDRRGLRCSVKLYRNPGTAAAPRKPTQTMTPGHRSDVSSRNHRDTCVFTACPRACARSEPVRTPHVEAELVAARTAIVPGHPLTVALRLVMQRGWHTYWRNPGDSGLPTTIEWKLPPGLAAGPIQWPLPRALPVGPLRQLRLRRRGAAAGRHQRFHRLSAAGAPTTLSARADWLVCKEICIPEGADLALTLPVATHAESDAQWAAPIAAARAAVPQPLAGWRVDVHCRRRQTSVLTLTGEGSRADPGALYFFPFAEGRDRAGRRAGGHPRWCDHHAHLAGSEAARREPSADSPAS